MDSGPTPVAGDSLEVDPEVQRLRGELESILRSTGNRQGDWAVLALSLDRHDTLLALNPDRPMVPASNMKLLSTAAALHFLGPDYRYRTFLLADGPVLEGSLDGDLILYGTGDPTFSERFWPSETGALDSLAEPAPGHGNQGGPGRSGRGRQLLLGARTFTRSGRPRT